MESAYVYEEMRIEDYNEVYALWDATENVGLSPADRRENVAAYLSKSPDQSFVCRYDNVIVGTVLCANDGRRAYIYHLAVKPEHRRQGIAHKLVELAMMAQEAYGIGKCHIFVYEDNHAGSAFWENEGFDKRDDLYIMSKNV